MNKKELKCGIFECPKSIKTYTVYNSFKKHMKKTHPIEWAFRKTEEAISKQKNFKCLAEGCYKMFASKQIMQLHYNKCILKPQQEESKGSSYVPDALSVQPQLNLLIKMAILAKLTRFMASSNLSNSNTSDLNMDFAANIVAIQDSISDIKDTISDIKVPVSKQRGFLKSQRQLTGQQSVEDLVQTLQQDVRMSVPHCETDFSVLAEHNEQPGRPLDRLSLLKRPLKTRLFQRQPFLNNKGMVNFGRSKVIFEAPPRAHMNDYERAQMLSHRMYFAFNKRGESKIDFKYGTKRQLALMGEAAIVAIKRSLGTQKSLPYTVPICLENTAYQDDNKRQQTPPPKTPEIKEAVMTNYVPIEEKKNKESEIDDDGYDSDFSIKDKNTSTQYRTDIYLSQEGVDIVASTLLVLKEIREQAEQVKQFELHSHSLKIIVEETLGTSLNRLKQRRFKIFNLLFSCSVETGKTVIDLGTYLSPEVKAQFTQQELRSTVHYPATVPSKSTLYERCRKRLDKLELFGKELNLLLGLLELAKTHDRYGWDLLNASWTKASQEEKQGAYCWNGKKIGWRYFIKKGEWKLSQCLKDMQLLDSANTSQRIKFSRLGEVVKQDKNGQDVYCCLYHWNQVREMERQIQRFSKQSSIDKQLYGGGGGVQGVQKEIAKLKKQLSREILVLVFSDGTDTILELDQQEMGENNCLEIKGPTKRDIIRNV